MTQHKLTFQFKTETFDETKEDVGGVSVGRTRTERTLTGDVEGTAVAFYIMTYFGPKTDAKCGAQSASFDGEMVVNGTLLGKSGSFAMRASGMYTGTVENSWTIVPETATGELKGLRGTGAYSITSGEHKPVHCSLVVEL